MFSRNCFFLLNFHTFKPYKIDPVQDFPTIFQCSCTNPTQVHRQTISNTPLLPHTYYSVQQFETVKSFPGKLQRSLGKPPSFPRWRKNERGNGGKKLTQDEAARNRKWHKPLGKYITYILLPYHWKSIIKFLKLCKPGKISSPASSLASSSWGCPWQQQQHQPWMCFQDGFSMHS